MKIILGSIESLRLDWNILVFIVKRKKGGRKGRGEKGRKGSKVRWIVNLVMLLRRLF